MVPLTSLDLLDALRSPFGAERLGESGPLVLVECDPGLDDDQVAGSVEALASLPLVVVGLDPAPGVNRAVHAACDVVLAADELEGVRRTVTAHPVASVALAVLLRGGPDRSFGAGLAAESAVYSVLQSGPEFASWQAGRPPREQTSGPGEDPGAVEGIAEVVRVAREDAVLHVTLDRPEVHNAFSAAMRDQLIGALLVARADPTIRQVVLDGAGPSFCSGGDVDEFGTFEDPASAHLVRLGVSAARTLHSVADRTEVHLHGACLGSGIELAAVASVVVAHPDTRIGLPEIGLGLIPGAGGTVTLPARIGRHRTAHLALSGSTIDAETAQRWGLVDAIRA